MAGLGRRSAPHHHFEKSIDIYAGQDNDIYYILLIPIAVHTKAFIWALSLIPPWQINEFSRNLNAPLRKNMKVSRKCA